VSFEILTEGEYYMKKIVCLAALLVMLATGNANALTFVCANCSTNLVQMLDRITSIEQLSSLLKQYDEAVTQTAQQIEMVRQNIEQYANMVQNTAQLPLHLVNELKGRLTQLANLTSQLKTLRGDVTSLAQIFNNIYPEHGLFGDIAGASPAQMAKAAEKYQAAWDSWSENVDRAAQSAFQLSGAQLDELQKDASKFQNYLDNLLSTPDGQMKAIMAGNNLAALQVQESRQLRELMATQVQNSISTQMKTEKESQMEQEAWRDATKTDGLGKLTSKPDPF